MRNYEARTETEPVEKKAKRKLKNYKLKHSRLLTCCSALLYLLAVYEVEGTVTPEGARVMTQRTPVDRLRGLLERQEHAAAHATIRQLLEGYERFLDRTDAPDADLVARFMDAGQAKGYIREQNEFGDTVGEALKLIGQGRFYRLLLV